MFDGLQKWSFVALVAGILSASPLWAAVNVFPNPVRVSRGQTEIVFDKLNPGSKITIFNVQGVAVREVNVGGATTFHWNIRNNSGNDVASGVYVYFISGSGSGESGKIAVIR